MDWFIVSRCEQSCLYEEYMKNIALNYFSSTHNLGLYEQNLLKCGAGKPALLTTHAQLTTLTKTENLRIQNIPRCAMIVRLSLSNNKAARGRHAVLSNLILQCRGTTNKPCFIKESLTRRTRPVYWKVVPTRQQFKN